MSNSNKKRKIIAATAVVGHILAILILWLVLRDNNIQEPVYTKVISTKFTTLPPSHQLPVLKQETRDKIEKEERQKEETEWKKQQNNLKKKHEAEVKKKKEAEAKKKLEAKKKTEPKKKEEPVKKKPEKTKKTEDLKKKKAAEAKKALDAKKKREKELADKKRRAKMAADKRAREAAAMAANAARQANLGKHITTDIVTRLSDEWNKGNNSALQFKDPNDYVKITCVIRRDGTLASARVVTKAKSASLNAKAAALIRTISRNGYRFPPFDPKYNKNSIPITRSFRIQ